jgi:hypothetical protein
LRAGEREIGGARVFEVGAVLEVARIFGGLAVDDARVGRGGEVGGAPGLDEGAEELALHGIGERIEAERVFDDVRALARESGS